MILLTSNSNLSSGILLLGFTSIPFGCVSSLKVTKYADFIVPSFPGCPFGITKSNICVFSILLSNTIAGLPDSPVVVFPILIVSATPSLPSLPRGPVGPMIIGIQLLFFKHSISLFILL